MPAHTSTERKKNRRGAVTVVKSTRRARPAKPKPRPQRAR